MYQCIRLFPTTLGEILPNPSEESWRPALVREAGFTSCGAGVLGVALLVVEVGEFLG